MRHAKAERLMSLRGQLLLGTSLATILLGFFFYGVDWRALGDALAGARPVPLVGVFLAMVAAYAVRAWRWADLLAPLGRVKYSDLFSATMVGFASSLAVPRAGELLRPWLISRRHPIPTSAGFATIVVERLIDLLSVLVLFALYLFALPRPAAQVEGHFTDLLKLGAAVAGVAALAVLGFLFALHANAERVSARLDQLLARAPRWLATPAGRLLRAFSDGLAVLRASLPHLAKIGLQSIVLWVVTALALHLNHAAFAIDLPFHATFLLIALLVVGEVIPTPGMVGSFHAFYLLALSEGYAVDRATAAAAGIAAHALIHLPVLVFGLALLGREGLSVGGAIRAARPR